MDGQYPSSYFLPEHSIFLNLDHVIEITFLLLLKNKLLLSPWNKCQGPGNLQCRFFFPCEISQGKKIYHLRNFNIKEKQGTSPQFLSFRSKTFTFFNFQGDQMRFILTSRPLKFNKCLHRQGWTFCQTNNTLKISDVSVCDPWIHNLEKVEDRGV